MAISCIESTVRKPAADRATGYSLPVLGGWLDAFVSACVMLGGILGNRTELDDLSEGQLADIGFRRFARRERWLDGSETLLPLHYEYRAPPGSARSG